MRMLSELRMSWRAILLLLVVAVSCAVLYDTGLYHRIGFHPIPQHEPLTAFPEAH